jgi:hypothetical protein
MLVGGGNSRLLGWARDNADLIGLSGLGKTLEDGHSHTVRWRLDEIDAQVEAVRGKQIEALVQMVEITDDPQAVLTDLAERTWLSVEELRQVPYLLVGSEQEIVAAVAGHRRRWGITRYAVRRNALDLLGPLIPRLSD